MPKFRFRLQPVLDHRDRTEKDKQLLMAAAERRLAHELRTLHDLETEFASGSESLRLRHKAMELDELRLTYAHLDFVTRAMKDQEVRIDAARAEVDRARDALLAARKQTRVMETLKDRYHEAHVAGEQAQEQRDLDDSNARHYESSAEGHIGVR